MIDSHVHIFTLKNIPRNFIPGGIMKYLLDKELSALATILHWLNPFSNRDVFEKYKCFLETAKKRDARDIFEELLRYYPNDARIAVHSIDFEFMGAGNPESNLWSQLRDLINVKSRYGKMVIPFIGIDPRRRDAFDVLSYMHKTHGFKGVKLYPALGFMPNDIRLYRIYEYCQANNLPVVLHTSRGGIFSYEGINWDYIRRYSPLVKVESCFLQTQQKKCNYYTDPRNMDAIIKAFPELKVVFAHAGGYKDWNKIKGIPLQHPGYLSVDDNWAEVVFDMVSKNFNVYADISSLIPEKKSLRNIVNASGDHSFAKKIIYGSDFYMSQLDDFEERIINRFQSMPENLTTLMQDTAKQIFDI